METTVTLAAVAGALQESLAVIVPLFVGLTIVVVLVNLLTDRGRG